VGDELYTYDLIGNLLSKTGVGALTVACGLFSAPVIRPIPIDGLCRWAIASRNSSCVLRKADGFHTMRNLCDVYVL
jgi:hypothetical protein